MQGYMATLSAMEYECDKAIAEYKSFVEFCDTFEGDEIPDDLYTVAQEVYGADLAKSAGSAIVKLAKKIWEWIVKILTFIEDLVIKFFKSKFYKASFERFKRLKEKLASDRATYDSRLKDASRFAPKKDELNKYQANLSILFSLNGKLIDALTDKPNSDLMKVLAEVGCPLTADVKKGMDNKQVMCWSLVVVDPKTGARLEFSKDIFQKLVAITLGSDDNSWDTHQLINAIDGVVTMNAMAIKTPIKPLITKAKFEAKRMTDEVQAKAETVQGAMEQAGHDQLMAARSVVKAVTQILQLEMQLSIVLSNTVERMGAYCISPGALNLKDADLAYKNNNASGSPFIAFNIGSVLSPFSK